MIVALHGWSGFFWNPLCDGRDWKSWMSHFAAIFNVCTVFCVVFFFPHGHLPSCTDLLGFLRPASLCCCHSESIHISQSMIRKTHFINIAFTNRFSQCIHTCFVHCPSISFTTFVSQREKYILTVYSPLASYMYILWLDRFISLHTALCSSTLDPFSPKAKSPVSWLGFNKCSLLLTSYFSKKNYSGGKGGGWNGPLCMPPPQSRVSFPHQPSLLIRMSNCFFSSSPSAERQVLLLSFLSSAKVWHVGSRAPSSTLHIISSVCL